MGHELMMYSGSDDIAVTMEKSEKVELIGLADAARMVGSKGQKRIKNDSQVWFFFFFWLEQLVRH